MAQRDPHDVLEVPRDAGPAAVKAAWRRLAREHHPDLAADSAARLEATRRMADPAFYQQDSSEITRAANRLKELEEELALAYQRWEDLEQG